MMPFAEFRRRYLDHRLADNDIPRISHAAEMAHAYWLLSDDEEQLDAALAFVKQCRAQINERVRVLAESLPPPPPARDITGGQGARVWLLEDFEAHQRKAAIAAVEVRS